MELIWERQDAYQGNRPVWDPETLSYVNIDHNEVYTFDGPPPRCWSDRAEIWMANYRCNHTNPSDDLGWHRSLQQNIEDWDWLRGTGLRSWCQRVHYNPWLVSADFFAAQDRWWTQATSAIWFARELWMNGNPDSFVLVRFTENKTLRGSDGILRRAAPPLQDVGYTDWKMDGSPTNPTVVTENSVLDGFYQGFVTVSILPVNAQTNWGANATGEDLGPIVWPRRGYRQWRSDLGTPPGHTTAWQQTSTGCRHPHALVDGGYVYLFYLVDTGVAPDGSWDPPSELGIFVARAPWGSRPTPGSWRCGAGLWVPCLPAGYATTPRTTWEDALAHPGPDVPPVLNLADWPGLTSLHVSRLSGTTPQAYVGIAERFDGTRGYVEVFVSTDLIHWTHHSRAYEYQGWDSDEALHYPVAVDPSSGDSSTVGPDGFSIVGGAGGPGCVAWHCRVNRIAVTNFH